VFVFPFLRQILQTYFAEGVLYEMAYVSTSLKQQFTPLLKVTCQGQTFPVTCRKNKDGRSDFFLLFCCLHVYVNVAYVYVQNTLILSLELRYIYS